MATNDDDEDDFPPPWEDPANEELAKAVGAEFTAILDADRRKLMRWFTKQIDEANNRHAALVVEHAQRIQKELGERVEAVAVRMAQDILDLRDRVEALEAAARDGQTG